jgi:hypothetical protein
MMRSEELVRAYLVRKERTTNGVECYVAWFPGADGCKSQAGDERAAIESLYELYPRFAAVVGELPPLRTELGGAPDVVVVWHGNREAQPPPL